MKILNLWNRILRRDICKADIASEIEAHLTMAAADKMAGGTSPDVARSEAQREFDNVPLVKEMTWRSWGWTWLDRLQQDISYGVRTLWRAPSFTFGAIAILAIGIGANLAEFDIIDAAFFHRIAARDADKLLHFVPRSKAHNSEQLPYAAFSFYQRHSQLLSSLLAESTTDDLTLEGDPNTVRTHFVSGNYFTELGIRPAYGRLLQERDSAPDAFAAVVLGYSYWQRQFGGDPRLVGRVIHLNGQPVQVAGILPYDFDGLRTHNISLWLPMSARPYLFVGSQALQDFNRRDIEVVGKLKPGISLAAAEQELDSLTQELHREHPNSIGPDERIVGEPLEAMHRSLREIDPTFAMISLLVFSVLLSACAAVGTLLIARGVARQHELDIRLAVGATRWRILRQLMTENIVLAVLGAGAGLVFGRITSALLLRALAIPSPIRITTDWRVLSLGVIITFVSVLGFGLPAALQTVRRPRAIRMRQVMVGVQVATTCVLLTVACLLARGATRSAHLDVLFDYEKMVIADPQLYEHNLPPKIEQQRLEDITTRLAQIPGVDGVAIAVAPPLSGRRWVTSLPGLPLLYPDNVSASYFSVMRLAIVRGRTFLPGEENIAIVSQSAARAMWANEDPIGKVWEFDGKKLTVVAVVKDSGANEFINPGSIEAYTPLSDERMQEAMLIVHTTGNPVGLVRMAQSATSLPGAPVFVSLMLEGLDDLTHSLRKVIIIVVALALGAGFLATAGILGLFTFTVAQRTREIAVRISIGAQATDVLRAITAQSVAPILIGAGAGVFISYAVGSIIHAQIYGVKPLDLFSYIVALACFALIVVIAGLSPALRALSINPASTLRHE
jgi:predicted permease